MPRVLDSVDTYIQNINSQAYQNVYMVSNPVLSRNPYTSRFLHRMIFEDDAAPPVRFRVLIRLLVYFIRSLSRFLIFVVIFMFARIRRSKRDNGMDKDHKHTRYIVDTYVLIDNVIKDNQYREQYFVGLFDVLRASQRRFCVLPDSTER
jgi:hypothetical protein